MRLDEHVEITSRRETDSRYVSLSHPFATFSSIVELSISICRKLPSPTVQTYASLRFSVGWYYKMKNACIAIQKLHYLLQCLYVLMNCAEYFARYSAWFWGPLGASSWTQCATKTIQNYGSSSNVT